MTFFKIYEIDVKIFSLQDFGQEEACSITSSFIDACLSKNEKYLEFHKKNCYKGYSLNSPYPLEPDGIYKKEKLYTIRIRTMNKGLVDYLMETLPDMANEYMKGLVVKVHVIPRRHITRLYSITPVVMKFEEDGYWKSHISFEEYEKLLKTNLVKKFNQFMGVKIDENFQLYTNIQKTNRVPIKIKYKNIVLLGDKFDIEIADNEMAQDLAYLALAAGLGENNARACGFVNYKFL